MLASAADFLAAFNYELLTIQLLKKGKPLDCQAIPFKDFKKLWPKLEKAQKFQAEIYFMVNEGDGKIHPGNAIPRSQENVTSLKACYIDTDNCPWETVKEYLDKIELKPSAIIETSPGKYHVYFFLEDTELNTSNVNKWRKIQATFAENLPGSDTSMTDYAKVLRIPGFYHLKDPSNPHLITVKKIYPDTRYELDQLLKTLCVSHTDLAVSHTQPYEISFDQIPEGSRHQEMTAFLGHMLNLGNSAEIALLAFHEYARTRFSTPKDWLPNGKRYEEVTTFINWKLNDLAKEEKAAQLKSANAIMQDTNPTFDLPDEFYFNAPGLTGDIVQEISSSARYPIPSFAFATAIAVLGYLKQNSISNLDHPPASYFLCLAPTGGGKNYAQEILSHTFSQLNLTHALSSGIRSEKGIARFLEQNQSSGLLCLDEAEHFFESLAERNTPHYLKQCKSLLLEVYTSANMPHKSLGQIGNVKEKPIVLSYPRLNVIAYGVLHTLKNAFTKKSVQDGLLQRFIVLTSFKERKRNLEHRRVTALNGHIFDALKDIVVKNKLALEQNFIESQDLEAEIESEKSQQTIEKLKKELTDLRERHRQKRVISFSADALRKYNEYIDFCDNQVNEELKNESGLEGVFTRSAEQVGRLACAMNSGQIDGKLIEYLTTFMQSRTSALHKIASDSFKSKDIAVQDEVAEIKKYVARRIRTTENPVPYREIARFFRIRDPQRLKNILQFAVEMGELEVSTLKNKRGSKSQVFSLGSALNES